MTSSELAVAECGCIDPTVFGHLCLAGRPKPAEIICHCNERPRPQLRWRLRDDGTEEAVTFRPGYVCERPQGSGQSHGRHGLEVLWVLRGPLGAATFLIYTDWAPGPRQRDPRLEAIAYLFPMGADLGVHSRQPLFDDHESLPGDCQFTGSTCYYDGSAMMAQELADQLRSLGDEVVWRALSYEYHERLTGRQETADGCIGYEPSPERREISGLHNRVQRQRHRHAAAEQP